MRLHLDLESAAEKRYDYGRVCILSVRERPMQPNPLFAIGIIIGLTIGIFLGIGMGNVALGMPAGAMLGLLIGLLMVKSGSDQ